MNIIIFIVVLLVLVVIHEYGHFLAAKRSGIRVDEFGVGFPPRLFSVCRGETLYSVNAIPFGGFVKIFGEQAGDVESTDPDVARSFSKKPRLVQAKVLVMGVVFNMLAGWLLLAVGFMIGMPRVLEPGSKNLSSIENAQFMITGVMPGSPADEGMLQSGDVVVAVTRDNGSTPMMLTQEAIRTFVTEDTTPVTITYMRDGVESSSEITPEILTEGGEALLGVSFDVVGTLQLPIHKALWQGLMESFRMFYMVLSSFAHLIAGIFTGDASLEALSGPVGIAGIAGDAAEQGFSVLLSFAAIISINLAVLNLIPFPALDGGRLLFLAIEGVRGKAIPPQVQNTANLIGFLLLIGLMLVVTYKDIIRLVL